MPEVDPVILDMRADLRGYHANLARAERQSTRTFGNIERQSTRMGAGIARSAQFAGRALLAYLGASVTLGAARGILQLVDASKQIEAQLRLATRETGSFAQAQEDVRRIAAQTRSGLDETARLYSVFARDSEALGISQLEAARATETLTKSFVISGASAAETAGATRQLIQGLQSGTLRGDEFNSVMEQAPRLQKLFAGALGVSKGELRAMAEEGKITAAALVNALTNRKFTEGIDAEFRELPVTFDQAMQQVTNAAIITFGAFDRGGGFSQMLANFITDGTSGFAELEQAALETGIDIRSTFEGLGDVFEPLLNAARTTFGDIEGGAMTLADRIRPLFEDIDSITGFLNTSFKPEIRGPWYNPSIGGSITQNGTNLLDTFNQGQARADQERRRELGLTPIRGAMRALTEAARQTGTEPVRGSTAAGAKPRARGTSAETLARRAEQERLNAIRDEGSQQRELLALQDDILSARAALATATEDVLAFELQQIDNEMAQRLSQLNTERRLGDLSEDEYGLRARGLAVEADLERQLARRLKNEADLALTVAQQAAAARNEIGTLEAEAELARTREERVDIERQILRRAYQAEEEEIRQAAAAGDIADLDEALANLKRRQLAEEQVLARANMSPGERYLDDLRLEAENLGDAYEDIAVRGLDRMNEALSENIKNALGLHGALGDIIGDFIELAIRQQVLGPLAQGIFGGGGGGGLFGSILSAVGLATGGGKVAGMQGGLKGFASGGSMMLGGRGGTDSNVLSLNGQPFARVSRGERMDIVPNQALARPGQQGGTVRVVIEEAPGFAARVRTEATGVAVEVVRTAAPSLIDAASNETMRRASRPSI